MIDRNVPIRCTGSKTFMFETTHAEAKIICKKLEKGCLLYMDLRDLKTPKTQAELNTIHTLITHWWLSDCHSAPDSVKTEKQFKDWIKGEYGINWRKEVGDHIYIHIKSFRDYSKNELAQTITRVKHDIEYSGALAESEKLQQIFAGIEAE